MSLRNSSSLTAPPLPPISLNTPLLNNRSRNITQKVLSLLQIPNNSIKGKKTNRQSFRFSFYQSKNYYHNREKILNIISVVIYITLEIFFFSLTKFFACTSNGENVERSNWIYVSGLKGPVSGIINIFRSIRTSIAIEIEKEIMNACNFLSSLFFSFFFPSINQR